MGKALLAVGLVLALAAPAQATTIEGGGSYPYQRWVDRAKVPTPDATLKIIEQACETNGDWAIACTQEGTDTIFLSAPMAWGAKSALYHELGHQFDYRHLTDDERASFMALTGLGGAWRQPEIQHDSPHEVFADVYGLCAEGGWGPKGNIRAPFGRRIMLGACELI